MSQQGILVSPRIGARSQPIGRVAILRALPGLGDMLCALPALASLRAGFPDAHVALIALERLDWVDERFPGLIDEWLGFPGYPGLPERCYDAGRLSAFLAEAGPARQWDVAIQMHGDGSVSTGFAAALGAERLIGSGLDGWYPRGGEAARWLALVEQLGIPAASETVRFPVTALDRDELAALGLPERRYVVLHPGASDPARRWSPARFAAIGDRLAQAGHTVVLTGTHGEREATGAVAAAMTRPAIDICGCTPLGVAAALLDGARAVVTNDTGMSHLAAAVGAPSVVIFLASDRTRWAPPNRALHRPVGAGRPDPLPGQPALAIVAPPPGVDDVLAELASLGLFDA